MRLWLWLSRAFAKAAQVSLFGSPTPPTKGKRQLIPQKRAVKRGGKVFQQTFWIDPSEQITAPRQPSLFEALTRKPEPTKQAPPATITQGGLFSQPAPAATKKVEQDSKPATPQSVTERPARAKWLISDSFWRDITPERARAAIAGGADVNAATDTGRTPLELAVRSSHQPEVVVRALIAAGADVHARSVTGTTPLHSAVVMGKSAGVVEVLREAGANPRAQDKYERTPLNLLMRRRERAEQAFRNNPTSDNQEELELVQAMTRALTARRSKPASPEPQTAATTSKPPEAPPQSSAVSREQWRQTPEEFKSVVDGRPHLLQLDRETGEVAPTPVAVVDPVLPQAKEKLISAGVKEQVAKAAKLDYDRPLSETLSALPAFGFDLLTKATPAQRKAANQRAIELADKLLAQQRPPTAEERKELAAYTGDGGVTGDINAHYTPTRVAAAMWRLLTRAGFKGGRVLEPSMGAGVFVETAPANAEMTGVELSKTTSNVASLLHPKLSLHGSQPFEEYNTSSDDALFDAVIANPPYGVRGVFAGIDKPEVQQAERYFINTGLDRLKDGGVAAFLINGSPLETAGARGYRAELLARAEVLGTYQLPSSTFKESNSGVPPALLLLRKRPTEIGTALARLVERHGESVLEAAGVADEGFLSGSSLSHPDNIFGTWDGTIAFKGYKQIAGELDDQTITRLGEAPFREEHGAPTTPEELARYLVQGGVTDEDDVMSAVTYARSRHYPIAEGTIHPNGKWVFRHHRWHRIDEGNPTLERGMGLAEELERFVQVRRSATKEAEALRQRLVGEVQRFIAEHGDPNDDDALKRAVKHNNRIAHLLAAVEDGKLASYLSEPLRREDAPEVDQANPHSVAQHLARRGELTPANLARHVQAGTFATPEAGEAFLNEHYAVDEAGRWLPNDEFYYGSVVERQAAMEAAAAAAEARGDRKLAEKYRRQAARFRELLPPKRLEDFEVTARSKWVPTHVVQAFVEEVLDPGATYEVTQVNGVFYVEGRSGRRVTPSILEDFRRYLNYSTEVEAVRNQERKSRAEVQAERKASIERAKQLEEQFSQQFQSWLGGSDYREAVEAAYNEKINNYLAPKLSGEALEIAGWAGPPMHSYQNAAVRHALQAGNSIMALDVGLGKTFAGCALVGKLRETGQAKKPLIVSPKSIMKNWRSNLKATLPDLKVLVIGETQAADGSWKDDGEKEVAKKLVQAATGQHDAILISRDWFGSIPIKPDNVERLTMSDVEIRRQAELREGETEAYKGQARRRRGKTARDISAENQKAMQKAASKMFKHLVKPLYFEDIGVDALIADESHCFPAGTMIDGKPIEYYKPGDQVRAFDHGMGRVVMARVANLQTRTPRDLYTVKCEDGTTITCTGLHPFFTPEGYVFAKDLVVGDVVYRANKNLHDILSYDPDDLRAVSYFDTPKPLPEEAIEAGGGPQPLLQQEMCEPGTESAKAGVSRPASTSGVPILPQGICFEQSPGLEEAYQGGDNVLLREVVRHEVESGATSLEANFRGRCQEGVRGLPEASFGGSSAGAARHRQTGVSCENKPLVASQESPPDTARGEWPRANAATKGAPRSITRMGSRILDPNGHEAGQRIPPRLQGRSCAPNSAVSSRSGRSIPSLTVQTSTRPEEAGDVGRLRVVCVTVHQPTGDGSFGGLCPDGVVYNIEVEQHHNYFANDILVHNSYKNLHAAPTTFGQQPKFMGGGAESKRAQDFLFKSRLTREATGGTGIHLLTATPTKNSPLEIFNMLKHVTPALEEMGIPTVDDFVARYCDIGTAIVPNAAGELATVPAVTGFKNLTELRGIMGRFIKRKTAVEVGLKIPERVDENQYFTLDPEVQSIYNSLAAQAKEAAGKIGASGDEHLFSFFSSMRKLTLDPALYSPTLASKPNPRYQKAAEIATQALAEDGKVVMFMDMGRESALEEGDAIPGEDAAVTNAYDRLVRHLVEAGVPKDKIAVATADTLKSSAARGEIEDKFNAGDLRVVIGSTGVIGEGFNLQKGTSDMVHLDTPWDPGTYWQRLGRAVRQGNPRETVRNHVLLAQGSFDGLTYSTMLGKRGWTQQLWESGEDRSSNEAAGVNQYEEVVAMLASDPTQAREYIREQKQQIEQKAVEARRLQALRGLGQLSRRRAALTATQKRLTGSETRLSELNRRLSGTADPLVRTRIEEAIAETTKQRETFHERISALQQEIEDATHKAAADPDLPDDYRPLLQGSQPFLVDDGGRVYAEGGSFVMAKRHWDKEPRPYRIIEVDPAKQQVTAAPLFPKNLSEENPHTYNIADLVSSSAHAPTVRGRHYEEHLGQYVEQGGLDHLKFIDPDLTRRYAGVIQEALSRSANVQSAFVVTKDGALEYRTGALRRKIELQPGERFLINTPDDAALFSRRYPDGVEGSLIHAMPFPVDKKYIEDPSATWGTARRFVPREGPYRYAIKAQALPALYLLTSRPITGLLAKADKGEMRARADKEQFNLLLQAAKGKRLVYFTKESS